MEPGGTGGGPGGRMPERSEGDGSPGAGGPVRRYPAGRTARQPRRVHLFHEPAGEHRGMDAAVRERRASTNTRTGG